MKKFWTWPIIVLSMLLACGCGSSKKIGVDPKTPPANPEAQVIPPSSTNVLQITEKTASGKTIVLKSNYRIVDPNSSLEIKLDKGLLSTKVADPATDEIVNRIKNFTNLISQQVVAMKYLQTAIEVYTKNPNDPELPKILGRLGPFTSAVFDDPEYANLSINFVGLDFMGQYGALFEAARQLTVRLSDKILRDEAKAGVLVQLGGWIDNSDGRHAVHIEGYDDIQESAYKVEQFQLALTDDQKKQLQDFSAMADQANKDGLKSVIDANQTVKNILGNILQQPSFKKIDRLKAMIETDLSGVKGDISLIQQNLANVKTDLDGFAQYVTTLISKYGSKAGQSASDLLLQTNDDFNDLLSHIDDLKTKLQSEATLISNNINRLNAVAKADMTAIVGQVKGVGDEIRKEVGDLENSLRNSISTIIRGERTNSAAYEFDHLVKKISIGNLPDVGLLDLGGSGKRDLGDRLTIKLASYKQDGSKTELASVTYSMYFCTAYVRLAPSFLFTDPVPIFKKDPNKSLFFYAPAYSILLKGIWLGQEKSRKNFSYHSLLSPGVGVNITTLDFNSDGAPEIGIGGAISLFSDFVQIGYGVNTVLGVGYSFFGFKFPIGSLALR